MARLLSEYPTRIHLRHSATGRMLPFVLRPGDGIGGPYYSADETALTPADMDALGLTVWTAFAPDEALRMAGRSQMAGGRARALDVLTRSERRMHRAASRAAIRAAIRAAMHTTTRPGAADTGVQA